MSEVDWVSLLWQSPKYPKTHVLSIEPAAPSWLLQQLNLVCNLSLQIMQIHPVLAGVVVHDNTSTSDLAWPNCCGVLRKHA